MRQRQVDGVQQDVKLLTAAVANWQLLGLLDPQDENPRMGMEHLLDCLDSELRFDICDLGSS